MENKKIIYLKPVITEDREFTPYLEVAEDNTVSVFFENMFPHEFSILESENGMVLFELMMEGIEAVISNGKMDSHDFSLEVSPYGETQLRTNLVLERELNEDDKGTLSEVVEILDAVFEIQSNLTESFLRRIKEKRNDKKLENGFYSTTSGNLKDKKTGAKERVLDRARTDATSSLTNDRGIEKDPQGNLHAHAERSKKKNKVIKSFSTSRNKTLSAHAKSDKKVDKSYVKGQTKLAKADEKATAAASDWAGTKADAESKISNTSSVKKIHKLAKKVDKNYLQNKKEVDKATGKVAKIVDKTGDKIQDADKKSLDATREFVKDKTQKDKELGKIDRMSDKKVLSESYDTVDALIIQHKENKIGDVVLIHALTELIENITPRLNVAVDLTDDKYPVIGTEIFFGTKEPSRVFTTNVLINREFLKSASLHAIRKAIELEALALDKKFANAHAFRNTIVSGTEVWLKDYLVLILENVEITNNLLLQSGEEELVKLAVDPKDILEALQEIHLTRNMNEFLETLYSKRIIGKRDYLEQLKKFTKMNYGAEKHPDEVSEMVYTKLIADKADKDTYDKIPDSQELHYNKGGLSIKGN